MKILNLFYKKDFLKINFTSVKISVENSIIKEKLIKLPVEMAAMMGYHSAYWS